MTHNKCSFSEPSEIARGHIDELKVAKMVHSKLWLYLFWVDLQCDSSPERRGQASAWPRR